MTRIVFHLGDKKAGSTAIQTTLASRAWTCDGVRLSYPTQGRINHIHLAKALVRSGAGGFQGDPVFDELAETIRSENPDVAIVSSEDFEDVSPEALRAALDIHLPEFADGARFISYVRPHAERVASSFAERTKAGSFSGTMEELFEKFQATGMLDYTRRFGAWRAVFGDRFVLRPMIREALLDRDVVRDFLAFALQTEDFTLGPTPSANESVSLEDLAILREYQLALRGTSRRRSDFQPSVGRDLARRMSEAAGPGGTKVRIHKDLAERVRVACAADAKALDAAFFTGAPMATALAAAPDRAVEAAQSLALGDHYAPREEYLIRVFIDHAVAMVQAEPEAIAEKLRADHRDRTVAADKANPGEGAASEVAETKGKPARRKKKLAAANREKARGGAGARRRGRRGEAEG